MRYTRVFAVLAVLLAVGTGTALAADARGYPELSVTLSERTVVPGEETTLQVAVTNTGNVLDNAGAKPRYTDRVTTARGLTVSLAEGNAPITVQTGPRAVGTLPEGTATVGFDVSVDEDAEPGTYRVPVTAEYTYTRYISDNSQMDRQRTRTFTVTLEVEEDARVEVVDVSSEARIGSTGTVAVTVENTGSEVARDGALELTSHNADLHFGGSVSAQRSVGRLEPGEHRTVAYETTVASSAKRQPYAFDATLHYEDADGTRTSSETRTVAVTPQREQTFAIESVASQVTVGNSGTVTVTMRNTGPIAVSDARVTLAANSSDLTFSGSPSSTRFVGAWAPNETRTLTFDVTATEDADTRKYSLAATVAYLDGESDTETAPSRSFGVTPRHEQTFVIESAESQVAVGNTGTVSVTMRNTGPNAVSDARVKLTADSPGLTFSGSTSTTRFVGTWAPGETRTLTYDITATEDAATRSYSLDATVTYRDDEGDTETAPSRSFGVTPAPEGNFTVSEVSLTRFGNSAILSAAVTNDGARPAKNAVVVLRTGNGSVRAVEPTSPVGTLEPGESADVRFDLRLAPNVNPGPRQFTAYVRYDQGEVHDYRSDPLPVRTTVETDDRIAVEPVNATFGIDTTNELRVRITNTGDEPLEEVQAHLSALSPYTSETPSSYVPSLDPGESAILTFEVTTPEDAVPTTDALAVNVTAETATDQSIQAGPYLVPITIEAAGSVAGGTTVLAVLAVVVVVVLAAGWWWLNR